MTLSSRGATGNLRTVVVEGGNVVVRAGDDKALDSPWITRAEIVGFIHRGTVRSHKDGGGFENRVGQSQACGEQRCDISHAAGKGLGGCHCCARVMLGSVSATLCGW